jgi:hypothetical protein
MSQTATPAPPKTVPLTVEVSTSVNVEETVDLVALFSRMDERAQKRYFALDPHEYSIAAEWERPLAYLWPDASDLIPLTLIHGSTTHPRGDINDSDVRVLRRNGEPVYGRDARWSEADYLRLASLVPWLAAHAGGPEQHRATPSESGTPAEQTLTVEVTASYGVEQNVDLCALFAGMDLAARQRYFDLDVSEVGFEAEWERPLAYVWPDEDDLIPYSMVPSSASHPRGMVDDADIRVIKRGDKSFYGPEARWTEADYTLLAEHVPWLQQHLNGQSLSEHDRARLPGPNDVPLFG